MSQAQPVPRSLRRTHILWGVLIPLLLGLVIFAAANLWDFQRFRRAWNIGDTLGAGELRAIAQACSAAEAGGGPRRLSGSALPPAFRSLQPDSATFFPGGSDVVLYEAADVYVHLRCRSSPHDQELLLFTNSFGRQQTRRLWHSHPERAALLDPAGRVVTVTFHSRPSRSWIVLPQEIRVVDRPTFVGQSDTLVTRVPLLDAQRLEIAAAAARIPRSMRGRRYTSGGADGIWLVFDFSREGTGGDDVVELANTWRDEVKPLVDTLSAFVPDHGIDFQSRLRRIEEEIGAGPTEQMVVALTDVAAADRPALSWHGLWRRVLLW